MNTGLIGKISSIATPMIESVGAYLVEVSIRGEQGSTVAEIFIDTDSGVTSGQCAEISRLISRELENSSIIEGRYRLEVSSPGLDRPLRLPRQFRRHVGRELRVVRRSSVASSPIIGVLREMTDTSLAIFVDSNAAISVPLDDVLEAYVVPRFK